VANLQRQVEIFADFFIRCALPMSGERIAGLIVLTQHKRKERKSEAQITIRSASPIGIEIGY
jgi:hypothetical protein